MFSEYLPQIGIEIATEHYCHQSFLSVGFRKYGARVLLRFPFAFIFGSIKGWLQRSAMSFLALTLSFEKLVASKHILMIFSAMLRSWCIKSILWSNINAFA
jgi:hypothetical protein